jgi:glycosyltransferase involved in cell wall biosynthesis
MHIVLVDDSIPFDGRSPESQPLGGPEKAFASLPGALARRGHRVQVFNRAAASCECEGAAWESWQGTRPVECEVLIAFRRPELLGFVAHSGKKVLWIAGPAQYLSEERNRGLLFAHRPTLVFMGEAHSASYRAPDFELRTAVVAPGIRPGYLQDTPAAPLIPPYAVATSHPELGLPWLIKLWTARIYPRCPHAELRLYSAVLDRALFGAPVAEPFKPVAALALDARDKGVAIHRPGSDPVMAEAYRGARLHLHPGDAREVYCYTLAESQACGTPAVARPTPAAAERIADNVSGHLALEEDAFVGFTLGLLEDDRTYVRLSEGARGRAKERTWERAAAAFEAIWL